MQDVSDLLFLPKSSVDHELPGLDSYCVICEGGRSSSSQGGNEPPGFSFHKAARCVWAVGDVYLLTLVLLLAMGCFLLAQLSSWATLEILSQRAEERFFFLPERILLDFFCL